MASKLYTAQEMHEMAENIFRVDVMDGLTCRENCYPIKRTVRAMLRQAADIIDRLEKAKNAICHHAKYICQSLSWENSNIQSNCADVLCAHRDLCEAKTAINSALAKAAGESDDVSK